MNKVGKLMLCASAVLLAAACVSSCSSAPPAASPTTPAARAPGAPSRPLPNPAGPLGVTVRYQQQGPVIVTSPVPPTVQQLPSGAWIVSFGDAASPAPGITAANAK